MQQIISLAVLVGGIFLIVYGYNESESFASDVSRFFHDSPTDRAIWMLVTGVMLCIAGLAGILIRSKLPHNS